MALLRPTRELLTFLRTNPAVRDQIRAAPNKTLLYAGQLIRPAWRELADLRRADPRVADKVMMADVLEYIPTPAAPFPNLQEWAMSLDHLTPWNENGFISWRALSGIFASNAVGTVSFYIGSDVRRDNKVFAATELPVLAKNPNIDALTKDIVAYYQRCIQNKQSDLNFSFIAG